MPGRESHRFSSRRSRPPWRRPLNTAWPTKKSAGFATNRDLQEAVRTGRFRPDLFYRLNVFPVEMPPLRERRADIPQLVMFFLSRFSRKLGKQISAVAPETIQHLCAYEWPGNVRELQNVIERAVVL